MFVLKNTNIFYPVYDNIITSNRLFLHKNSENMKGEYPHMKKLSLLLAIMMMMTALVPAFAETATEGPTEAELLAQNCDFALIEANGDQPRLTYIEGVTNILDVDGLKFKDMNGNGKLDVYEDYRQDTDARVADLLSQMTNEEKAGLLFCVSAKLDDARTLIPDFKNNCMLFNLNGTPVSVVNTLNNLQAKAEEERLSIPMTFTSDREYNAFAGYIDKAHIGFGTANDPELAYKLAYLYGKAMVAIGVHVTFEPYANEIGAQYGENPEHIAAIVSQEVKGLEDAGFASCVKHWIGRGGDSNFGNARSIAQNFDNWMVGWKAALSGGNEWVMTNCGGTGITNTVDVKWDRVTMSYLRDTLGFDGVVVTDWWALGMRTKVSGVNPDGVELSEQSFEWLYGKALEYGTDVFGAGSLNHGLEVTNTMGNWPDVMIHGMETGEVEMQYVDRAATRVLRFKFNKGLFENPYRVVEEALATVASAEYAANPTEIKTNEDLRAARLPEEVELAEQLQAKSAVLVKNDSDILPLKEGTKIYIESSNTDTLPHYVQYLNQFGTVVDSIADADVVIGYFSTINDAAELMIEDAQDAGKPVILTLTSKATEYTLKNSNALIYMPYSQQPDHGSGEAGFIYGTEPWIYADLLFGVREPEGIIQKEQARNNFEDAAQWKDLAGDQGASPYVRLMVQATMEDDENHASPSNWGDPLISYNYGMRYGKQPEFKYSCLILPISQVEEESTDSRGNAVFTVVNKTEAKAGEPFTIYALLRNNGADGITTVQALANGEVVAEKIMTVSGGSWRVLQMDLTLAAGEYTIQVGDLTGTMTVVD